MSAPEERDVVLAEHARGHVAHHEPGLGRERGRDAPARSAPASGLRSSRSSSRAATGSRMRERVEAHGRPLGPAHGTTHQAHRKNPSSPPSTSGHTGGGGRQRQRSRNSIGGNGGENPRGAPRPAPPSRERGQPARTAPLHPAPTNRKGRGGRAPPQRQAGTPSEVRQPLVQRRPPARTGRRTPRPARARRPASNTSASASPPRPRPSQRRRDSRPLARPQRVHADGRLVLVVLAPVDQHLALRSSSAMLDTISSGCSRLEGAARARREPLGAVVVVHVVDVQRHVHLDPLRAGRLGEALEPERSSASRRTGDLAAVQRAAGRPGSRSNAITVGRSTSGTIDSDGCSSRSARLASHTSVGRSSQTQKSIVLPLARPARCAPSRAGATGTASRRSGRPRRHSGSASA